MVKKLVSIQLDEDKVREIAYDLSQKPLSYDDCVWFYAENELKLRSAYSAGMIYREGDSSKISDLNLNAIVDQPSEDEIRRVAEDISRMGISPQDLHWYIAERKYLYDTAKNMY